MPLGTKRKGNPLPDLVLKDEGVESVVVKEGLSVLLLGAPDVGGNGANHPRLLLVLPGKGQQRSLRCQQPSHSEQSVQFPIKKFIIERHRSHRVNP